MEIMMKMTDFRHLRLKTKQERTLYSSLLGHNVSCNINSLISLTDLVDSQLAAHNSSLAASQFVRLDTIHASFDSSKTTLARVTYLSLRRFT